MSSVKGKNTKPEVRLRKLLWREGLRYRLHYPVTGKPDFVFLGKKLAVFVDGCFWHGCPDHRSIPQTNHEFWLKKIRNNIARDEQVTKALTDQGWQVLRVWEHEIKEDVAEVVDRIKKVLWKNF